MINLEDYSKSFQDLLNSYQGTSKTYSKLKNLFDLQKEELETTKNNEMSLKRKLNSSIVEQCDNNLLAQHINLKALYETLKTENREHESDKIIMKNEYIKECTRLKEQQSDVLAKLENTYQKNISDLEKKERELTEALSMSQKKSAMEYDLMQSNLTELLIESNKKIKALESANSILRYELQNSKNRNNIKENPKNETKMQILRQEVMKAENNLKILQSNNNNIAQSVILNDEDLCEFRNDVPDFSKKNVESNDKYQTLNVISSTSKNSFIDYESKKIYKKNKEKTFLPPLVQVKSSFQNMQTIKKRKLYNPEENEFYQD